MCCDQDAAKAQKAAEEELKQAQEALKKAKDGKAKKEAEEAEKTAKLKQKGKHSPVLIVEWSLPLCCWWLICWIQNDVKKAKEWL